MYAGIPWYLASMAVSARTDGATPAPRRRQSTGEPTTSLERVLLPNPCGEADPADVELPDNPPALAAASVRWAMRSESLTARAWREAAS